MKPEDRLRDAIHDYTDQVEPADAWGRIRERTSERRRRPWWRLAVAGTAAVALAITAVVLVRAGDESNAPQIATPGGTEDASRVAAITDDGRLVLLDPETGAEVQTLADDASPTGGLAATPDGSHLFYTRDTGDECRGIPFKVLVRLEVATGATEVVSSGVRYPAVSPDGRSLAFTGIPNCSDAGNRILVTDLQGNGGRDFGGESWWPSNLGIGLLSWAPDSQHLLFTPWDDPGGTFPRILDTTSPTSLEETPRVVNPDGSRINGYFGPDWFVGVSCRGGDQLEPVDIVIFDVGTGDIDDVLFHVPEECGSDPIVVADAENFEFLILVTGRTSGHLYHWREGDTAPTQIADGVAAAAWIARAGEDAPPPSSVPSELVVVPDVIGLDESTASQALQSAGFVVEVTYRSGQQPGQVLEQDPVVGTSLGRGSPVALVVGTYASCGDLPLVPTELPDGFSASPVAGPSPEATADDLGQVVVHYTDGGGRSIEVRRPGTVWLEITGYGDNPPADAYVLGQPVQIAPIAPTLDEPLLAVFYFPQGAPEDLCTRYSLSGYGVTEAELKLFAESLITTP